MATLFVIGTPIGNLKDISERALEILKSVDLIAAEDTRVTRKLLARYGIKTQLISYHQYSRVQKIDFILDKLRAGSNIALVSDAGTPGIADPGGVLVFEVVKAGFEAIPIPGPQAAVTALSVSGFPADKFLFLGFLPKKKARQKMLSKMKELLKDFPIVLYESPYRIIKTLNDLQLTIGDKQIVVCRELTKKFETIYRGKISQILPKIKPKGEFVIVAKKSK